MRIKNGKVSQEIDPESKEVIETSNIRLIRVFRNGVLMEPLLVLPRGALRLELVRGTCLPNKPLRVEPEIEKVLHVSNSFSAILTENQPRYTQRGKSLMRSIAKTKNKELLIILLIVGSVLCGMTVIAGLMFQNAVDMGMI